MKHNTMGNLTEQPLQEVNIKQTCLCEKSNNIAGTVQYVTTEIKLFGEL